MKDTYIQVHPGFIAAMHLELRDSQHDLIFEKEHNLNASLPAADLLVIKEAPSAQIQNEIGVFFRGHSGESLDINAFYKCIAYAGLYKSYGNALDERKADDITVSIIRESLPRELFKYLSRHGFSIVNPAYGIYHIYGKILFPTQIIITKELNTRKHAWLKALSANLTKNDIQNLLDNIQSLSDPSDLEIAGSVLEASFSANRQIIQQLIGDDTMYEVLMEIMEPKLRIRDMEREQKGLQKGLKEGIQQGIKGTVEILRDLGLKDAVIKTMIMEKYNLKADEAVHYLQ